MKAMFEEMAYRLCGGATLVNHRHSKQDSYEIIHVLGGEGSVFLQDRTYPLTQGMLLFIDAANLHGILPDNVNAYRRSKVIVDKRYLQGIFEAMQAQEIPEELFSARSGCYYLDDSQSQQADELFRGMTREYEKENGSLFRIMLALLGLCALCGQIKEPAGPREGDKLAPALGYIRHHYAEALTVEMIAENTHLSKYYLCHLFRKQTGFTLMQYLYEVRLSAARRLLSTTDMSISDIALNCGFGSSSHFCTLFKRHEGLSPRDFRRTQETRVNV